MSMNRLTDTSPPLVLEQALADCTFLRSQFDRPEAVVHSTSFDLLVASSAKRLRSVKLGGLGGKTLKNLLSAMDLWSKRSNDLEAAKSIAQHSGQLRRLCSVASAQSTTPAAAMAARASFTPAPGPANSDHVQSPSPALAEDAGSVNSPKALCTEVKPTYFASKRQLRVGPSFYKHRRPAKRIGELLEAAQESKWEEQFEMPEDWDQDTKSATIQTINEVQTLLKFMGDGENWIRWEYVNPPATDNENHTNA
jgi:hypothetical protein